MARSRFIFQTDSGIDLLTGPHQTIFDELGSSTIRLSEFSQKRGRFYLEEIGPF